MKRTVILLLSFTMLLTASSCSIIPDNFPDTSTGDVQISEITRLTNKMTDAELSRTYKHDLTLLDSPTETEYKVEIELASATADELIARLEKIRDSISDEEYEAELEKIAERTKDGYYTYPLFALINGYLYSADLIPPIDYDGGEISFTAYVKDDETDRGVRKIITCANSEEYFKWYKQSQMEFGGLEDVVKNEVEQSRIIFNAIISGDYEILPSGSIDFEDTSMFNNPLADYRNTWEYDREAVESIRNSIEEISIYDEELQAEFLVHVTLPPNYDRNSTYPVFLMTDAVWSFGNHTELRKLMEEEKASDVILVSLGYDYHTDGTEEGFRLSHLVWNSDKLLDFITDNLMPFLGKYYDIDYANSTLYGHAYGGVFVHNALFKSDLYDNQPFGNYIIGSPAFWTLYTDSDLDAEGCQNDYGYFDRNEKLDKKVFLCGGSLEDPDYADKYNGHDSTLEGLEKLNNRLESRNAEVTCKLYESHHYQYILDMLAEFLKETYPFQPAQ